MTLRHPWTLSTLLTGVTFVTALLVVFDPATTWWFPSCPFFAVTGWLCPLCGSLRAVHALLQGAPRTAWALNPMTTAGLLAGVAAVVADAAHPARARCLEWLARRCFSARALALVVFFGVCRNVPTFAGWLGPLR
jgi:uncharacterized membrane protein HdeD (DUF308 family)